MSPSVSNISLNDLQLVKNMIWYFVGEMICSRTIHQLEPLSISCFVIDSILIMESDKTVMVVYLVFNPKLL